MRNLFLTVFICLFVITSCHFSKQNQNDQDIGLSGDLIIFHAGSLSVPFQQIADSFSAKHPDVNIKLEAAGSVTCARKISELNRPCDVMASADYNVINNLLIPEHASWNIKFASNEMVIAYHRDSKYHDIINDQNCFELIDRDDVIYGRSNPDSDPCGYRAVLSLKLAEKVYQKSGLADKILNKDQEYIRPKEVDLIALAETNVIDYFFIYRSVAEQHGFTYLLLPDSVNLKKPELAGFYSSVDVQIAGNAPVAFIIQKGEPMVYGITIPQSAPNKKVALEFVKFVLDNNHGMKIIELNGQPSVIPSRSETWKDIPHSLKLFATG